MALATGRAAVRERQSRPQERGVPDHRRHFGGAVRARAGRDGLGRPKDVSGEAFPLTPKWQVTADAEYRRPIGGGLTALVGTTASYVTRTDAGLGEVPLLAISGYALMDMRSGLEVGRRSVQLLVRNVANRRYATNVSAIWPDTIVRLTGGQGPWGSALPC